ncbi:hypothetical protein F4678DRAFT_326370 [Xylaria arbuscula]|nr:hypothetical protein F4678DRAFT_326370 [Xylaria arbuscula]
MGTYIVSQHGHSGYPGTSPTDTLFAVAHLFDLSFSPITIPPPPSLCRRIGIYHLEQRHRQCALSAVLRSKTRALHPAQNVEVLSLAARPCPEASERHVDSTSQGQGAARWTQKMSEVDTEVELERAYRVIRKFLYDMVVSATLTFHLGCQQSYERLISRFTDGELVDKLRLNWSDYNGDLTLRLLNFHMQQLFLSFFKICH